MRIQHLKVCVQLDFAGIHVKSFLFANSKSTGDLNMCQGHIEESLIVSRVVLGDDAESSRKGSLRLEFAKVGGELAIDPQTSSGEDDSNTTKSSNSFGSIYATGLSVGARIRINSTDVHDEIVFDSVTVDGPVVIKGAASPLSIGGRLSFNSAEVNGSMSLDRVCVSGSRSDTRRGDHPGTDGDSAEPNYGNGTIVDFRHLIVRGDLNIRHGEFGETSKELPYGLHLRSAEIDGDFLLVSTKINGHLSLEDCLIKGGGNLGGATIKGDLDMRSSVVRGQVFGDGLKHSSDGDGEKPWPDVEGQIKARRAHLRELIIFTGATPRSGKPSLFDLSFSKIDSLQVWYPNPNNLLGIKVSTLRPPTFDCDGMEFREIKVQLAGNDRGKVEPEDNAYRLVYLMIKDISYNRSVFLSIERWLRINGFDLYADSVFEHAWSLSKNGKGSNVRGLGTIPSTQPTQDSESTTSRVTFVLTHIAHVLNRRILFSIKSWFVALLGWFFGNGVRVVSPALILWLCLFAVEIATFSRAGAEQSIAMSDGSERFREHVSVFDGVRVAVGLSFPPALAVDRSEWRPSKRSACPIPPCSYATAATVLSWCNLALIIFGMPNAFLALFRRRMNLGR